MGTIVTVQIVDHEGTEQSQTHYESALDRAIAWFEQVERRCSRFDPSSELSRLSRQSGAAMPASTLLFEAVRFAITVAADTDGAFDPTIGLSMERRGFNREHRSGATIETPLPSDSAASFRDVQIDPERCTISFARPLLLDLGAIAKGLAIDMAARELQPFGDFAIDAGGDLYLGGRSPAGDRWRVGIRHPRHEDALAGAVRVSDRAVCTSGDYERRAPVDGGSHIVDPRTGQPGASVASVTVIAESAMLADALGTAAFVLGPHEGLALFERHGVDGLILTPTLEWHATPGMQRTYDFGQEAAAPGVGSAILQDTEGTAAHSADRDRRPGDPKYQSAAHPAGPR